MYGSRETWWHTCVDAAVWGTSDCCDSYPSKRRQNTTHQRDIVVASCDRLRIGSSTTKSTRMIGVSCCRLIQPPSGSAGTRPSGKSPTGMGKLSCTSIEEFRHKAKKCYAGGGGEATSGFLCENSGVEASDGRWGGSGPYLAASRLTLK